MASLTGQRLPENFPPSFLLRADFKIVPFHGRENERGELRGWCADPSPFLVRLITGPGGQGKTRLAREICHELASEGWVAGFAGPNLSVDRLAGLVRRGVPSLVVVDYAETAEERVRMLADVLLNAVSAKAHVGEGPADDGSGSVRILLLARSAGDWWTKLREDATEALAAELYRAVRTDLAPLYAGSVDRPAAFTAARDEFAARLGLDPHRVVPPPDLAGDQYGLASALHMTALAMLLDSAEERTLRPALHDPAARVLEHERRYWRVSAVAAGLLDASGRVGPTGLDANVLDYVVAAATLCGAAMQDEARLLLSAIPELADQSHAMVSRYARWAAELHPGTDALNALQPDRLGEDHVAQVVDRAPHLIEPLVTRADDAQLRRALTVLARAGQRHQNLEPAIHHVLDHDLDSTLPLAVEVATQVADPAPLAAAITKLVGRVRSPHTLRAMVRQLPAYTVALAEAAVLVQGTAVTLAREAVGDDDPELGRLLAGYAARLAQTGEYEQSLVAAEDAVRLLGRDVAVHRQELALALSALGGNLAELGRFDEAVTAFRESLRHHEQLYAANPARVGPDLVKCLNSLFDVLVKLGRTRDAARYSSRCHAVLLQLATGTDSPELRALRAGALARGIGGLRPAGRHPDPVEATAEALQLLRPLAAWRPDAYRPALAQALDVRGAVLGHLSRFREALAPAREAAEIYTELAERHPGRYRVGLAKARDQHAGILVHLDRGDEAFDVIAQTVKAYLVQLDQRPDAFFGDIGRIANNISAIATRTRHTDPALDLLQAAEQRCRELVDADPAAPRRRAALGAVLAARAHIQNYARRHQEGMASAEAAVSVLRAASAGSDRTYRTELANALAVLAATQARNGDHATCISTAHEAVDLYQSSPDWEGRHASNIAMNINSMMPVLVGTNLTSAETLCRRAAALLRGPSRQSPRWAENLAAVLHNHAVTLAMLGSSEWLPVINEAIVICQKMVGLNADLPVDVRKSLSRDLEHSLGFRTNMHARRVSIQAGGNAPPGRNDPCVCGSGKKHKRCCGSPERRMGL